MTERRDSKHDGNRYCVGGKEYNDKSEKEVAGKLKGYVLFDQRGLGGEYSTHTSFD